MIYGFMNIHTSYGLNSSKLYRGLYRGLLQGLLIKGILGVEIMAHMALRAKL